jgi:A/G-specific adenine glycosylase
MTSPTLIRQFDEIPAYRKRFFRRQITIWFGKSKRTFLWRETDNPYYILVAEILLQQTDAKKVSLVYADFIRRYPNIAELACAQKDDVQSFISKIGLSYRTERLVNIAKEITERFAGQVPSSESELLSLTGVGRYIANAVLSAGFGRRLAVVDTNIVRILERFFGIRSQHSRPRTDPELWDVAHALLPRRSVDARTWNYALIDFCALVCTFYNPKCSDCACAGRRCQFLKHQQQIGF